MLRYPAVPRNPHVDILSRSEVPWAGLYVPCRARTVILAARIPSYAILLEAGAHPADAWVSDSFSNIHILPLIDAYDSVSEYLRLDCGFFVVCCFGWQCMTAVSHRFFLGTCTLAGQTTRHSICRPETYLVAKVTQAIQVPLSVLVRVYGALRLAAPVSSRSFS